jgi:hypothetical protein
VNLVITPFDHSNDTSHRGGPWLLALGLWNVAVFSIWAVGPFVLAGSLWWVSGWFHLAVVSAGVVAESFFVTRANPELKARRKCIGRGTKTWDLVSTKSVLHVHDSSDRGGTHD